jgi:myo-inositol-1(or 4)-monophosphatase
MPRNPHINHISKLCRELEVDIRRAFEDAQRLQVTPAQAEELLAATQDNLSRRLKSALGPETILYTGAFAEDEALTYDHNFTGWLARPISHPRNFLHGRDPVSCLFAYIKSGYLQAGTAWFPMQDRMVAAAPGDGVAGPTRLRVAARTTLQDTLLLLPVKTEATLNLRLLEKSAGKNMHTRKSGNPVADAIDVAGGQADIAIATDLYPLEALLIDLFVREAGGFVSDLSGKPVTPETTDLVSANSKLHGLALKLLRGKA